MKQMIEEYGISLVMILLGGSILQIMNYFLDVITGG